MNPCSKKYRGNCFCNSPFLFLVLTAASFAGCVTMGSTKQEENVKVSIDELRLSSANNSQAIEELKAENEVLKGEIEKINFLVKQKDQALDVRLLAIEAKISSTTPPSNETSQQVVAPPPSVATATEVDIDKRYKMARKYHEEKKFDDAEAYYRSTIGTPSKWYEERALYFIGVMDYDKKDYEKAVIALQEFADNYPKSKNMSSAIYYQGESLKALGKNDEAKLFFEELMSKFPKSKEAREVKKRLKK